MPRMHPDHTTTRVTDTHLFAWNGLAFRVPMDWNLAAFDDTGRTLAIRMDDDVGIRLELEWMISPRALDVGNIKSRHEGLTAKLRNGAATSDAINGLPADWMATIHIMHDRRRLVLATFWDMSRRLLAFFRIHLEPGGRRMPAQLVRIIAESMEYRATGIRPWCVYDVAFDLPHEWRLVRTSFLAGRKLFIFEWRLRRLYLWFISLADMALKERSLSSWGAEFINRSKQITGPLFYDDGIAIKTRRKGGFRFGHFEEIGRATLNYDIRARHDVKSNQIRLAVLNYRTSDDLRMLPPETV